MKKEEKSPKQEEKKVQDAKEENAVEPKKDEKQVEQLYSLKGNPLTYLHLAKPPGYSSAYCDLCGSNRLQEQAAGFYHCPI